MRKWSSVPIAKNRLKSLVVLDRTQCRVEDYEMLKTELYHVVSKHIMIKKEEFHINITRNGIDIEFTGEK